MSESESVWETVKHGCKKNNVEGKVRRKFLGGRLIFYSYVISTELSPLTGQIRSGPIKVTRVFGTVRFHLKWKFRSVELIM